MKDNTKLKQQLKRELKDLETRYPNPKDRMVEVKYPIDLLKKILGRL